MKILHVTSGISPESGGPTRSVKGICRALDNIGEDITLQVLHGHHDFEKRGGVNIRYGKDVDVKGYDIAHIHGLWDLALHRVVNVCRENSIPYIISPRGMLDPWALSVKAWKKKLALLLYQKQDLMHAAGFHVTADAELCHVRALGLQQRCFVIPNGVDLPDKFPPRCNGDGSLGHKAVFLSRLHPGKGLLVLAEAWAKVKPSGWKMEVVGPDTYGHKEAVVARLQALGIAEQWHFAGMVDDVEKWTCYRSADLLVHPSVSENFGITIAEGLAAGLPVIATRGTPWSELETCECGWWIEQGVEALSDALEVATTISNETRIRMGENGMRLVRSKYTWDAVSYAMMNGYREILK